MVKKDKWEKYKEKNSVIGQPEKELVALVDSNSLNGFNVLELGCWDGRNTFFLASKGFTVYSIDNSRVMLDQVKNRAIDKNLIKNIILSKGNLSSIKFPDNNFDLILCCVYIFHEIGIGGVGNIINEAKEHLTDKGMVYFSFFSQMEGTRMEEGKYYPSKEEILNHFGRGWKIFKVKNKILEHKHSFNNSKIEILHKHNICHLFIVCTKH